MGIKKYLGLERRRFSRYATAVDVMFHVWDARKEKPLTPRVQGRLTDISQGGACLQTNQTLIEGYHLLLDKDMEGQTPVILEVQQAAGSEPFTIQAQVLWYNQVTSERKYKFDVGLEFVDLTSEQRERLNTLLTTAAES